MFDSVDTSFVIGMVVSVFMLSFGKVNGMGFSLFGQTRKGLSLGNPYSGCCLGYGTDSNFTLHTSTLSREFDDERFKFLKVVFLKTGLVVIVGDFVETGEDNDDTSFALSVTGEQIVTAFFILNLPVTNVFLDKMCEVNSTRQTLGPAI